VLLGFNAVNEVFDRIKKAALEDGHAQVYYPRGDPDSEF